MSYPISPSVGRSKEWGEVKGDIGRGIGMLVGAPSAVEAKDTRDRRGASYITLSNTSRVMESVLRVHSSGTYTGTKSSKREEPSIHRAVFFSFLFLLLLGWLTPHKVYIAQIGARGTGCFESRENYRKMRDFYHRQENGNSSRALAATQKKGKSHKMTLDS